MTRRRMAVLLSGVALLGGFSAYRLLDLGTPALPDKGEAPVIPQADGSLQIGRLQLEGGVYSFHGKTMGTTYSIKFVPQHPEMVELVPVKVDAVLQDVVSTMSTYDPKSELSVINQMPGGQAVVVSDPLFFVLELSAKLSEETRGAFDVTVAPLVKAFGFGAGASEDGPSKETLAELRKWVGMNHLKLDPAKKTVEKSDKAVNIDLSAVAKGYGVDVVADALESLDVMDYMVEVGGEIRVKGEKPKGAPWVLAIEHPDPNARRIYQTLRLPKEGAALATSGDYRNFRKEGETWISHTIDPRVGKPVPRRTASVSVVRPTAAEADALATGLGVLEPAESIGIANSHGWAVLLLIREGETGIVPLASTAYQALDTTTVE